MPERTEEQRAARRKYMKKWNAKRRQEKEELADFDARAMAVANSPIRLKPETGELAEKLKRRGGPKLAYRIPLLVDLTLALRKAGCKNAICTFADGSKITLR